MAEVSNRRLCPLTVRLRRLGGRGPEETDGAWKRNTAAVRSPIADAGRDADQAALRQWRRQLNDGIGDDARIQESRGVPPRPILVSHACSLRQVASADLVAGFALASMTP
jgi:hypothetical protein